MKLQLNIGTVVCAAFGALTIYSVIGRTGNYDSKKIFHSYQLPGDTSHKKDSVKLKYPIHDQQGDFITNPNNNPVDLNQPSNITDSVVYDPTTNQYELVQKYGNQFYRDPSYMSFDDFLQYEYGQNESEYFQEKRDASAVLDQSSVVPKINIDNKVFDRLFGSSAINIKPQGSIDLTFGDNFQNIENPILTVQQRKQSSFIFNMNINMNVVGTIGDKLKLGISYNTQSQFDFENQEKLGYSGDQDQIIKNVQAGNITLPLNSQLVQGSQSLFGVKTTLQFGRLTVTGVVAKENANEQSITVQNGTQQQNFQLKSDQYDQYRNYFLGQFFKENYDSWNKQHPIINTGVNITRIEVWETNITGATTNTRNVDAFMDMGENKPYDAKFNILMGYPTGSLPSFESTTIPAVPVSNNLNSILYGSGAGQLRTLATTTSELGNLGFQQVRDFEQTYARMLAPSEYTLQPNLGYIMLNQQLNPSEVLAVAYQYTYNGKVYQVGEFAEDIAPNANNPNVIYLKLLQNSAQTPTLPIWQLQMKNIYSLGAYQVSATNFLCNIFYLSPSGTQQQFIPAAPIQSTTLLRVEGLDVINSNNEPVPDGVFDFIPNVTINPALGKIIFPTVEPFGQDLKKAFRNPPGDTANAPPYIYQQLYDSTITVALEYPQFDRYLIQGTYQSSTSSVISLGAFNIPQGSVKVTAGGQTLVENQDYTIDYNLGQLRILNQNILASGLPINVSFENNASEGFDTKTLFGTVMQYNVNDNLQFGLTYLHLSERPYTVLLNVGQDPISNGVLDLNGNYHSQADWITKVLNGLPFYSTKAASSVTLSGEVARLFPGFSPSIGGSGQVYIDDFEGAQSTYPLTTPLTSWALCSVPHNLPINPNTTSGKMYFPEATENNELSEGYHRAKLAWYSIDPLFYSTASTNPTYIQSDTTDTSGLSSLYVRQVFNQEVYPTAQVIPGVPNYLPTMDVDYLPNERGPYNYDANLSDINTDGTFKNPEANFGGIMRALQYTDFDAANIEYLDVWVLYPFYSYPNYNKNHTNTGGKMIINLGDISEDILQDGHQFFENGLPTPDAQRPTQTSVWGIQPLVPPITDAFDNDPTTRPYEDVGFDGMSDAQEQTWPAFQPYLNSMKVNAPSAYSQIYADPSGDDYHYYLGSDYDAEHLSILRRYMAYNGTEGNSPVATSTQTIVSAETNVPDMEDINQDYTLESDENYYSYTIPITPTDTVPGQGYVFDKVDTTIKLPDGNSKTETWIEYQVPIESFSNIVGTISGFTSIRFMRMFFTGFSQQTIMRFGVLQFVRNTWRPYQLSLETPGENLGNATSSNTSFSIGTVSVEQNSTRKPVNYVMPPGVEQQVTQAFTGANVLQDETSLSLQIGDLTDGDARAAYKLVQVDMREYQRLLMFAHCEATSSDNVQNGDLMAFIRVGSDFTENYYEYALPLLVTPPGFYANGSTVVWPTQNNFNILLDSLVGIKVARDNAGASLTVPYVWNLPNGGTITIVGNPNIGQVTTIMLGVRNPKKGSRPGVADNGAPYSTDVWFDELRLSGFVEKGGDAAVMSGNVKLADLGTLTMSGNMHTIGWGQLSSSLDQRDMDNFYQFNAATQLQLGKLLPKFLGLSIPAYVGISESISLPEYSPTELDVPLSEALDETSNTRTRDSVRQAAETFTSIKSLNFTNIRRQNPNGKAKIHFYSLSNLNLTYAYTQTYNHNPTELSDISTLQHLQIGYNYAFKFKGFYPFSFISSKPKYLKFLKDLGFDPLPSAVSFTTSFDKLFESTILRPSFSGETGDTTFNEYFKNLRTYGVKWDFTKSLHVNFNATASSFIDEPYGYIDDKTAQDSLWTNLQHLGRLMTYNHTFDASYTLPFNKFPILDWISASAHYSASYGWIAAPLVADTSYGTDGTIEKIYLAPSPLGNIINNTQNIQLTGTLNFESLYNKSKFLKKFDTATQPAQKNNNNNKSKTPTTPQPKDKAKKEEPPVNPAEAFFVRLLLSLKKISVSYSESNATTLPGFTQTPTFVGENFSTNSPGIPFLLGYQPNSVWLMDAAAKGWITNDTALNYQFIQNFSTQFNAQVTIQPFKDFNLNLVWMRNYQLSTSEYFKDTPTLGGQDRFAFLNPLESGSFTISFFALRTLFEGSNQYGIPNSFSRFESYRSAISTRLGIVDPYSSLPADSAYYVGYGRYQQDVLLPAFLAAYAGKNPYQVGLNPFFNIPLPNWKITYNGLTKIKFFQNLFSSFSLSNGYTCTYSIGSFSNNLNFSGTTVDGNTVPTYIDPVTGSFVSFYEIPMVMITEQLAPLIGLNMTWKNGLITNFEYDFSRTLGFSFLNNQLAETETEQITLGLGYRWKRFPIPFKIHGLKKRLNNDLELRCDVSYTNNTAITYQLDQNFAQPTSGGQNILISPTITYVVNKQLNVQLFFNKNISLPATSASYPIIYTKVGITLKFTLQ
jgi:cell surface protein SprA